MSTSIKPALSAPTSARGEKHTSEPTPTESSQTVAAIALNMSWQLLVVVVLPVVGGHFLDNRYGTTPAWTTVGMVLALVGMIMVVRQTVKQLNVIMARDSKDGDK